MNQQSESKRVLALDALRGMAILLMVFSGRIPFGVLPDWMYHAQVPPPDHIFNPNLPGITWVDLVFPFFLFAMGAAIPLALSRRFAQGTTTLTIVRSILVRGLLLAWFAIYVQHIRPWQMADHPQAEHWLICLAGFILLFPMLARLPGSWSRVHRFGVAALGWLGAAVVMMLVVYKDGSGFSVKRSDIIILVLSNVAVFGALIWMATKQNILLRLLPLAMLLAMRLGSKDPGWTQWLWNISPLPWLFQVRFLQYLFIVIPGTIIGDLLLAWMNSPADARPTWRGKRDATLLLLMIALNVVVVVGLKARWVEATMAVSCVLGAISWLLLQHPSNATERLLRLIFLWGAAFLILGFFFEPYEGGIKKDHATLSYYWLTSGLASMMLIAFTIAVDVLQKGRWLNLLISSGQNPMIAYAGVNSFVPPILGLSGIATLLESVTASPWLGVLRGALITYLVALAASICTRWKIFLRT